MLRPFEMSVGRMRVSMVKPCLRFRAGVEGMVSAGLAPGRHDPARPSSPDGGGGAADKVHAVKRHAAILNNRPLAPRAGNEPFIRRLSCGRVRLIQPTPPLNDNRHDCMDRMLLDPPGKANPECRFASRQTRISRIGTDGLARCWSKPDLYKKLIANQVRREGLDSPFTQTWSGTTHGSRYFALQELVGFRRVGEGFHLRVEREAAFPGPPGDIRQVAKQRGLVALFHIRRRQRPRSDALQEILDVRRVALAAGDVLNQFGVCVKELPAIAMPADVHEPASAVAVRCAWS